MKNSVEIHISGQKFVVRSEESAAHVKRLAAYVDDKLREVLTKTNTINSYNAALLAALNIADDYFSERARRLEKQKALATQTRAINNLLDAYLKQEDGTVKSAS